MRQIIRFCRCWLAVAALLGAGLGAGLGGALAQNWPISESARQDWQAVGRVTIEGNTRSLCTGTLIAPDTVVTAAHCVTNGETGQPLPFYKLNFVAGWHDGEHAGGAVASFIRVHADYADTPGVARPKLAKFAADLAVVTPPLTRIFWGSAAPSSRAPPAGRFLKRPAKAGRLWAWSWPIPGAATGPCKDWPCGWTATGWRRYCRDLDPSISRASLLCSAHLTSKETDRCLTFD